LWLYHDITILVGGYWLLINVVTFAVFGLDKHRACARGRQSGSLRRVPEATLLWLAAYGGSVGAWLGMKVFAHKTLHSKFTILLPIMMVAQTVFLVAFFMWN